MKRNFKILIIAFLLTLFLGIYVYICAIESIPNHLVLFEGEKLNIKTFLGISIENNENTILTSTVSDNNEKNDVSKMNLKVKLFNSLNVKDINVDIIKKTKVIPVGAVGGLKLYTNGALVVGTSEIRGIDNKKYKPYENTKIQEGDVILAVNDVEISNTKELIEKVNSSGGNAIKIKYLQKGKIFEENIIPIETGENEYKIGIWVRDSAAGIGTMTYYEPETGNFAALGHGITDIDTGELIDIANGEFVTTKVLSIVKGIEGKPGKIQGTIVNQKKIGEIYKNTPMGVYGKISDISSIGIDSSKEMEVALRDEIKIGEATILCTLEDGGTKEYKIEIEKIFFNNDYDNKSMLIKVTDQELIEKTGGIIQGMSGSPIIQNGKFIGAITNVLVNSPTKGYAVFADIMLK